MRRLAVIGLVAGLAAAGFGIMALVGLNPATVSATPAGEAARAGSLDPGFGNGGVVLTGVRPASNRLAMSTLMRLGDDRLLAAGWSVPKGGRRYADHAFALARYRADGRLDSSFGSGGVSVIPLPGGRQGFWVVGLVRRANGRVVAVGRYQNPTTGGSGVATVGYRLDGRLNASYGSRGVALVHDPTLDPTAAIGAGSGRIIVASSIPQADSEGRDVGGGIRLVRLRPDGTLDQAFGHGGSATVRMSRGRGSALAVQPDGKILAGGGRPRRLVLARFLPSGRLDRTFGDGGIEQTSLGLDGAGVASIALAPSSGDIFTAGSAYAPGAKRTQFLVADFRSTGRPRRSFGTNGYALVHFGPQAGSGPASQPDASGRALVRQPDGRLAVAGTVYDYSPFGMRAALARLLPNGRLDPSFGSAGRTTTAIPGSAEVSALIRQSSGRLVAGGSAGTINDLPPRFLLLGYR